MSLISKLKEHLAVFVFYLLLCLLFFNEVIFQTQWFGEDFFSQNFPNRHFASVEISRGSFPLWNPYLFSGMPFLADIQTAVLYPFNLLLSLSVKDSNLSYVLFEYQVVFHFILCGYFMFLFLSSLYLDSYSSLLGGTLFAFSGFFINHAHHSNLIHSAIWLPAVFYCCQQGFTRHPGWIWGCPVLWVISLFGGHPQMTLFIIYASTAYYLYLTVTFQRQVKVKKNLYRLLLAVVLFFSLSLVQTLPTAEFLQHTSREVLNFEGATKDSLPLRGVWTLFMADLFLSTYESWQYWEFRSYPGTGALIAAIFGFLVRSRNKMFFFQVLALVAFILALGKNTLVYKVFFDFVPGFDFFRVPARFLFLFLFSISVLAAYGFFIVFGSESDNSSVAKLIRGLTMTASILFLAIPALSAFFIDAIKWQPHLFKYLTMGGLFLLAFFAALKYRKLSGVKFVVLILVVFDLFYFRGSFNQVKMTSEEMWRNIYENPVAITLKNQTEGTRFLAKNGFPLHANFGLIYRMSNTAGYNPFRLKGYGKLNLDKPEIASLLGTKLLDFKYLEILSNNWKDKGAFKLQVGPEGIGGRGFMLNEKALPRAFFIQRSKFDPFFDLQAIVNEGKFEPLKTVYLEKNFLDIEEDAAESIITRYKYTSSEIQVDLKNSTPGFLFVSEVYYPGWKARVNGNATEVLRANGLFRAVRVASPSSMEFANKVKLNFQPMSFTLGAIVSGTVFLLISLLFVFLIFKRWAARES